MNENLFPAPISLYYWPTPNCWKVTILCEEADLPYAIVPINILEREQHTDEYNRINRFRRVPTIVDPSGPDGKPITIAESAAVLLYLSQKCGRFGGRSVANDWQIMQWLLFQVGTMGPMLGQAHHFRTYATEKIPYAIDRYTSEATKIYRILDERLKETEYLCEYYSIADMCVFPWTVFYRRQGQDKENFPNFARWFETMKARPAVRRGIEVAKDLRSAGGLTADQHRNVFGDAAARAAR
jgi:GSH-dependent disulfide-bond oxidoreductase